MVAKANLAVLVRSSLLLEADIRLQAGYIRLQAGHVRLQAGHVRLQAGHVR